MKQSSFSLFLLAGVINICNASRTRHFPRLSSLRRNNFTLYFQHSPPQKLHVIFSLPFRNFDVVRLSNVLYLKKGCPCSADKLSSCLHFMSSFGRIISTWIGSVIYHVSHNVISSALVVCNGNRFILVLHKFLPTTSIHDLESESIHSLSRELSAHPSVLLPTEVC